MATPDFTPPVRSTVGFDRVPSLLSHATSPVMPEVTRPNTRPVHQPNRGSFPFSAPPCRIYRPSPSVMQPGQRKARGWVLEFERAGRTWIEPLMGWTATDDPFAPIRLTFPTLAAAVNYAERQGLDYRVIEPPAKRFIRKSYRDTILGSASRNGLVGQVVPGETPSENSARS